jgi:three-Cys-motif partner protein
MVSLDGYAGREQAYVKHVFLERYLEALIFKTASAYNHIVYVDGFAGPWQSAGEQFEDTSFGIALSMLRKAKDSWKRASGRDVKMTALLIEKDAKAFERLATIPAKYPDIEIKTHNADFLSIVPTIARDIPRIAFAFFLIDPKGWRIPLAALKPLLERPKSEVTFNFMFEFVNRAASMSDTLTVRGLDELIPYGDWRHRLKEAEETSGRHGITPEMRKEILVEGFKKSLRQIGRYGYVIETEVLRPLRDRTLYCLFYATRHDQGLAVFRDCQVKALIAQAETRAASKVQHAQRSSGQSELFSSLHDMAPDDTKELLARERKAAEDAIIELVPKSPAHITYGKLWSTVLGRHMVWRTEVNTICAKLRKSEALQFPNWESGKRTPKDHYLVQRP